MTDETTAGGDLLTRLETLMLRLAQGLAVLGAIALVALLGVTVGEVTSRYLFNAPIFGVEDISKMALTMVVAGSVAYGAHYNAHVSVNVIKYAGGRGLTRWSDLLVRALGVAVLLLAAYALYLKSVCGRPCGAFTNSLGIMHGPFYALLAAAMAAYAALLAVHLLIGLRHWSGEDPNEVPE